MWLWAPDQVRGDNRFGIFDGVAPLNRHVPAYALQCAAAGSTSGTVRGIFTVLPDYSGGPIAAGALFSNDLPLEP